MPGTLFVVATPIGNLEDITSRALRILREVSIVAAEDTRRTSNLFARYAITTPTTSLHAHNEGRKTPQLIARLTRGDNVAVVSDAGTPTISDPGAHLVEAAVAAGIRVESIPGPNAIIAALALAALPTSRFEFLGFPPIGAKDRKDWFNRLKRSDTTVVFFEAPHRIRQTLEAMLAAAGDCHVVVCRELTKVHEEVLRGRLSMVKDLIRRPRGEFTVVAEIGHTTEYDAKGGPSEADIFREFGVLTNDGRLTRRAAIAALAKRHQLRPNHVYKLIEASKHLANDRPGEK
jgi:16S rRNA (cytidine1402-2'-O)-methyltransferase